MLSLRGKVRWRWVARIVIGLALATLLAFYDLALGIPGFLLVRDDRPKSSADAIIVLMGDAIWRPMEAARLFQAGVAPKVYIASVASSPFLEEDIVPAEIEIMRKRLVREGVPNDRIVSLHGNPVSSTAEEALLYGAYFQKTGVFPKRIVLVTSWFHTSRTHWIFKKAFNNPEVHFETAATYSTTPMDWWKDEGSFFAVLSEYVKWTYYLARFSFRAFPQVKFAYADSGNIRLLSR